MTAPEPQYPKSSPRFPTPARPKGDFAAGQETVPIPPSHADFATGEHTLPATDAAGDFATGEHTLPASDASGDFATGQEATPNLPKK